MAEQTARCTASMFKNKRCRLPAVADGLCAIHAKDVKEGSLVAKASETMTDSPARKDFPPVEAGSFPPIPSGGQPEAMVIEELRNEKKGEGKRGLHVDVSRVAGTLTMPRLDSPTARISGPNWGGALSIVLDLDETLVATQHPDMPHDKLDIRQIVVGGETMNVAIRPLAFEFLEALNAQGNFEVYVLTAGSQRYCNAVVSILNRDKAYIRDGKAVPRRNGIPELKKFEHVLPEEILPSFAMAVDNRRTAWDPYYRDQVIIVPDYFPGWTQGMHETILCQVLTRIYTAYGVFARIYQSQNYRCTPLADIVSLMYEDEEKQRMMEADFGERGRTYLDFLTNRESRENTATPPRLPRPAGA